MCLVPLSGNKDVRYLQSRILLLACGWCLDVPVRYDLWSCTERIV
jgi:hypothetical protein